MGSAAAKMTMVEAINLALHQEMAADRSVVLLGEDIGRNEGVFRVTAGLHQAFGDERVVDAPLAESAIVGTAIGMALVGLRPVAEIQFSGFGFLALAQLDGHAARYRSRSCGQWTVPLVVRMPYGGGVRAHEHHSESRESTWASTPGLKVVVPSGPRNARSLLVAAIRDEDPVVFMEPKRSYRAFREDVPRESETKALGQAELVKPGKDVTLIAWGAMVPVARRAAETVERSRGAQVELIDLLTISPLDCDTLVESVRKTGRCVIAQEAPRSFSVSSEIVARLNDRALFYLEAPVERITGHDVVTPFFQREQLFIPDEQRIAQAIERLLDFR
jgi:pyruvate dehydrogenase E1 component beta subunit